MSTHDAPPPGSARTPEEGLVALAVEIGHDFVDPSLLAQSLTHSSFVHENGGQDYERLEFLGDAVLQLGSSALLYEQSPNAREGQLSRLRSRLVSTDALADLARRIGVGPALRLGVGEEATGGRDRPRVLAGATEAILGAVYLDGGAGPALDLVRRWLSGTLETLQNQEETAWKDPRSLLQELTQRDRGETPIYGVTDRIGPPHRPTFVVEVRVGDEVLGRGQGPSKREASRKAAEVALDEGGDE